MLLNQDLPWAEIWVALGAVDVRSSALADCGCYSLVSNATKCLADRSVLPTVLEAKNKYQYGVQALGEPSSGLQMSVILLCP